jgi:hypothetical protein
MDRPIRSLVTRALLGRSTLAVFLALVAGWYLPGVASEFAVLLFPLFLPAYLVTMVAYDGGVLEQVVYALDGSVPISGELLFEAGQVVTFYLFSAVAALVGSVVEGRFGPRDEEAGTPRVRYVVAGGLLLLGLGLFVGGIVSQPTMTSVTCESSASAAGNGTATATPECTRTTEPATGQRLYILALGLATGLLGGAVVAVDRWVAVRR